MEEKLSELETDLVDNYGLVRRCKEPEVIHGVASCNYKGKQLIGWQDTILKMFNEI